MLPRVWALATTVRRVFPFTGSGLVVLGASGFALRDYGVGRSDLLLLVMGLVGLALGALAFLAVVVAAVVVRLRLRGLASDAPLCLECGVAEPTRFSIPALRGIPLVKLGCSWLQPDAHVRVLLQDGRLWEHVIPRRRDRTDRVVRRVDVEDAFGLARVGFQVIERRPVCIVPSTGALRQVELLRGLAAGDDSDHPDGAPEGDRLDTRMYVPGDPLRFILWKVFARTRQLVVRMPERAFNWSHRTAAYLVVGPEDEPAAGVARRAIETGALGTRWVFGTDGTDHAASRVPMALDLIAGSGRVDVEAQGAGVRAFLGRHAGGAGVRVVVFVPARTGPWLSRVVTALRASGAPGRSEVAFLVCTDGIARDEHRSVFARLVFARERRACGDESRAPAGELAVVLRELGALAHVAVVHRVTGKVDNRAPPGVFRDVPREAIAWSSLPEVPR